MSGEASLVALCSSFLFGALHSRLVAKTLVHPQTQSSLCLHPFDQTPRRSNALIPPQDGSHAKRRMGLNREQMEALNGIEERAQRPTHLSLAPASSASSVSPSPTPSTPADSGLEYLRTLLWNAAFRYLLAFSNPWAAVEQNEWQCVICRGLLFVNGFLVGEHGG